MINNCAVSCPTQPAQVSMTFLWKPVQEVQFIVDLTVRVQVIIYLHSTAMEILTAISPKLRKQRLFSVILEGHDCRVG